MACVGARGGPRVENSNHGAAEGPCMAEDDDSEEDAEDAGPAVELGSGADVEGAPLARVAARHMWGMDKSTVIDREGGVDIRTPDGPKTLADILYDVDETYFPDRQSFEDAVREQVGTGPVPTED